jgi:hypothetical protein
MLRKVGLESDESEDMSYVETSENFEKQLSNDISLCTDFYFLYKLLKLYFINSLHDKMAFFFLF